jgi:hypothetical protein
MLVGCSPGPMIDRLPEGVGLPAGAPARPTASYQYPAVHDMPPARSAQPLSEDEQLKLEKDLAKLRDRQAREAAGTPETPAKKSAQAPQAAKTQPAKKKPADVIVVPPPGTAGRP